MINFSNKLLPTPLTAKFAMNDYHVWCGTMVKDNGRYHLFFSMWDKKFGHNGWVTNSKVGHAVSDDLFGTFEYKGIALDGRGHGFDADVIHNPVILPYDGKYYMYYMGNYGNGEYWNHRNNQRIGAAVADSPDGVWKRFDEPVIDVSAGEWDHLMVSNPTVTVGRDGRIVMMYKGVSGGEMPKGGSVVCGIAVADNPTGKFIKNREPIMVNPENNWSVEDPFIWYDKTDDMYYALVKDFQGYFSGTGTSCTVFFISKDGYDWNTAENPFAFGKTIRWDDGTITECHRLERPQIYFENGKPKALLCAVGEDKELKFAYNVRIKLDF